MGEQTRYSTVNRIRCSMDESASFVDHGMKSGARVPHPSSERCGLQREVGRRPELQTSLRARAGGAYKYDDGVSRAAL